MRTLSARKALSNYRHGGEKALWCVADPAAPPGLEGVPPLADEPVPKV